MILHMFCSNILFQQAGLKVWVNKPSPATHEKLFLQPVSSAQLRPLLIMKLGNLS